MIRKIPGVVKKLSSRMAGETERALTGQVHHNATPRLALEQWVGELNNLPSVKGRVAITTLRNKTWIEWAAYCAAVIRRMGYESTLIFKETEVKRIYQGIPYFNFWAGVTKIPGIRLVAFEELPFDPQKAAEYYADSENDMVAALAYDHHVESADILDNPSKYSQELEAFRHKAAANGAKIYRYFSTEPHHIFICYSGIIHDTSLLLRGALDAGQETACVECWGWRPGHMIYNFNAPSLEYNIRSWIRHFGDWDEKKNNELFEYFMFLDGAVPDSDWLKNFYFVQKAKVGVAIPGYILQFLKSDAKVFLLACNVIGDSSMLKRETIFRSHRDFVKQTVDFFSKNPQLKLIIRVHPGEQWVKGKVRIKMGDFASEISSGIENILVIPSHEKLNTFSLVPFIHAGLVWLTSAGVDLVARGIPVISAARPKYYNLGIVDEPASIPEYFERIQSLALSGEKPSRERLQRAKEYLYVVFKGFSFEAQGRTFGAESCILGKMPQQEEHDLFYRILLKEVPSPI